MAASLLVFIAKSPIDAERSKPDGGRYAKQQADASGHQAT
jgi:hypothetical protein